MRKPFILFLLFFMAPAAATSVTITFYFQEGCPDCAEVELVLSRIQERYGSSVSIERKNILSSEARAEFDRLGFDYTPALVIDGRAFRGKEQMTYENLVRLLDSYFFGFGVRLTPFLFAFLGVLSALSPPSLQIIHTLITTLARRDRSLAEALTKSFLEIFFFSFLLLLALALLSSVASLLYNVPYYGSAIMAFLCAFCALLVFNSGTSSLSYPVDFSRFRIRRIKTLAPKGVSASISLSLYMAASSLLVAVPALPVVMADGFFSRTLSGSLTHASFFCAGFFCLSLLVAVLSCFFEVSDMLARSRFYAILFSSGAALLLLAVVLTFPLGFGPFFAQVVAIVAIYILMGFGMNITLGLAGLLDLGFVAFFAVGAYTVGLLTATGEFGLAGWPWWAAAPFGVVFAMAFGAFLGLPILVLDRVQIAGSALRPGPALDRLGVHQGAAAEDAVAREHPAGGAVGVV